jgi:peptide/nickel transport system permease protein
VDAFERDIRQRRQQFGACRGPGRMGLPGAAVLKFFLKRLAIVIPTLLVISFLVFALMDTVPVDPARQIAGDTASLKTVQKVREQQGFDDPLLTRYWRWLEHAATGDLGTSYVRSERVSTLLADKIPVTASLLLLTLLFSTVGALVLGTAAALRPGGFIDRGVTSIAALAIAAPAFWIAGILVTVFAIKLQLLPSFGYVKFQNSPWEWFRHLLLPALALSAQPTAELALQLREALLEVMGRNHILVAEAKGLSSTKVVGKHAMKAAAVPVVTVLGVRIAALIGGAIVVEQVFGLNGLGSLVIEATLTKDTSVLLGVVIVTTLAVILINFAVDVSHSYFNPKVVH